jgi:uncharacterized HAD superfamily protein
MFNRLLDFIFDRGMTKEDVYRDIEKQINFIAHKPKKTMKLRLTISVDIDGILCAEELWEKRPFAKPIYENINKINALFSKGHHIILFTARGWNEYEMTENWLLVHGVLYDQLICGKPICDLGIDDRIESNFDNFMKRVEDAET